MAADERGLEADDYSEAINAIRDAARIMGPPEPGRETSWRRGVRDLASELISVCHDHAPEVRAVAKVAAANRATAPFIATLLKVEIEEATGRGLVTVKGTGDDAEEETLRTEFRNVTAGFDLIRRLEAEIGSVIRIWKFNEPMAASKKGHNVRMLVHFQVVRRPTGSPPRSSDRARRSPEDAPSSNPTSTTEVPGGGAEPAFDAREARVRSQAALSGLTADQRAAVAIQAMKRHGINNVGNAGAKVALLEALAEEIKSADLAKAELGATEVTEEEKF